MFLVLLWETLNFSQREKSPNTELFAQAEYQAQKQLRASQLWQQGLNDVILKSRDTIVLKTLPLVVQYKIFSLMSAQARNY